MSHPSRLKVDMMMHPIYPTWSRNWPGDVKRIPSDEGLCHAIEYSGVVVRRRMIPGSITSDMINKSLPSTDHLHLQDTPLVVSIWRTVCRIRSSIRGFLQSVLRCVKVSCSPPNTLCALRQIDSPWARCKPFLSSFQYCLAT